jgi:hypothetical protein
MAVDRSRDARPRLIARGAYFLGSMSARAETRRGGPLQDLVASASSSRRKPAGVIGILLGVRPQDVAPLARAEAGGDRISFVVHGAEEIRSGQLLDVAPRPVPRAVVQGNPEVELIAGTRREKVSVH